MKENEIIKKAAALFEKVEVIPAATPAEQDYYINHFNLKAIPEQYPTFFNRCLVRRFYVWFTYADYTEPVTLYTISQLQTLCEIQEAIQEAENNCNWDKADTLYIMQEDFLNDITPPDAYKAANISA